MSVLLNNFKKEVEDSRFFPYKGKDLINIFETGYAFYSDKTDSYLPLNLRIYKTSDFINKEAMIFSKIGIERLLINPVGLNTKVECVDANSLMKDKFRNRISVSNGVSYFEHRFLNSSILDEVFDKKDTFVMFLVHAEKFLNLNIRLKRENPVVGLGGFNTFNKYFFVLDKHYLSSHPDAELKHQIVSAHEAYHSIGKLKEAEYTPFHIKTDCIGYSENRTPSKLCDICKSRIRAYWRGVEEVKKIKILRQT